MLFTCCCMVVVVAVTAPTPSTWCQDLESSETVAWIRDGCMDPGWSHGSGTAFEQPRIVFLRV